MDFAILEVVVCFTKYLNWKQDFCVLKNIFFLALLIGKHQLEMSINLVAMSIPIAQTIIPKYSRSFFMPWGKSVFLSRSRFSY